MVWCSHFQATRFCILFRVGGCRTLPLLSFCHIQRSHCISSRHDFSIYDVGCTSWTCTGDSLAGQVFTTRSQLFPKLYPLQQLLACYGITSAWFTALRPFDRIHSLYFQHASQTLSTYSAMVVPILLLLPKSHFGVCDFHDLLSHPTFDPTLRPPLFLSCACLLSTSICLLLCTSLWVERFPLSAHGRLYLGWLAHFPNDGDGLIVSQGSVDCSYRYHTTFGFYRMGKNQAIKAVHALHNNDPPTATWHCTCKSRGWYLETFLSQDMVRAWTIWDPSADHDAEKHQPK